VSKTTSQPLSTEPAQHTKRARVHRSNAASPDLCGRAGRKMARKHPTTTHIKNDAEHRRSDKHFEEVVLGVSLRDALLEGLDLNPHPLAGPLLLVGVQCARQCGCSAIARLFSVYRSLPVVCVV
jgi:hypothetical protein